MHTGPIEVIPVSGALGAEVRGVDLAREIDEAALAAIRRAMAEHLVLFFRGQALTPERQVALTARLGPVLRVPFIAPLPDHPEVVAVLKEAHERGIGTFGGTWHSDFSFLEAPPSATLLFAVEVPTRGGDTLWANGYTAYEALTPAMREMLDRLGAVHAGLPYGTKAPPPADMALSASIKIARGDPTADAETVHPVVRRHPETGRRALFVNPVYTLRFDGMSEAESRPLLDFLYAHMTRPEFTCRFRWDAGALALWDNRCTLHLAINDYDGARRLLHRTTVAGERPLGPD